MIRIYNISVIFTPVWAEYALMKELSFELPKCRDEARLLCFSQLLPCLG